MCDRCRIPRCRRCSWLILFAVRLRYLDAQRYFCQAHSKLNFGFWYVVNIEVMKKLYYFDYNVWLIADDVFLDQWNISFWAYPNANGLDGDEKVIINCGAKTVFWIEVSSGMLTDTADFLSSFERVLDITLTYVLYLMTWECCFGWVDD